MKSRYCNKKIGSKVLLAATGQHWLQPNVGFLFQGRHTALQVADPHNIFCACQHAVQILTCPKPFGYWCEVFKLQNTVNLPLPWKKQQMQASDFLARVLYGQLPPMPKQLRIRPRNLPLLPRLQQFLYRPLRSLSWLFSRPFWKQWQ